jgi:hypothetical protein
MNAGLHLSTLVGLTSAAGLLLLVSGTKKKLLRWKAVPRRRCAGCGLDLRHCACGR